MFNTTILDVAIGMIFIYLLLSLMCTSASEIIELLLKKRAIDLERGIRELLVPGSASGTNDIVQNLYNHALVNSLFGGRYQHSRIASIKRYVMRTGLPSYIPSRNFALALMDLVLPGDAVAPPPPPPPAPVTGVSGAAGATPPPASFDVKLDAIPPPPPPPSDPRNPLARLRNAVGTSALLEDHARDALTALIDAAGHDVARARENIENWYDTSMDRVSSWYKRRSQVVILILGLFVAISVNADSITIAKRLSTDRPLRESLVAAAQEYSKAHAAASPTPSPSPSASPSPSSTPTPCPTPIPPPPPKAPEECAKDAKSAECQYAKILLTIPECAKDKNSAECKSKTELLEDCVTEPDSAECRYARVLVTISECLDDKNSSDCKQKALLATIPACRCDENSPQCKYEVNKQQLEALGLPIGWASVDDPKRKWPGLRFEGEGGWGEQIQWHWLGWLLTALAISLGAPFWFDLLNKFIVIRSAVKPHEKSPEEGSKD